MLVFGMVASNALSSSSTFAIFLREAVLTTVLLQLGYWTMACFIAGLLLSYIDIFALEIGSIKRLTTGAQSILYSAIFAVGYSLPACSCREPGVLTDDARLALVEPHDTWRIWGGAILSILAFTGCRSLYICYISYKLVAALLLRTSTPTSRPRQLYALPGSLAFVIHLRRTCSPRRGGQSARF